MLDIGHKIIKLYDHNRPLFFGMLMGLLLICGIVGCEVKTASVLDPSRQVTEDQLRREVAVGQASLDKRAVNITRDAEALEVDQTAFNERADAAGDDLTAKKEWRANLINTVGGVGLAVAEGTMSPAAAIGGAVQLALASVAAGAVLNARRKDKVIEDQKKSSVT